MTWKGGTARAAPTRVSKPAPVPMRDLSAAERDRAIYCMNIAYSRRNRENKSDDQVAEELGFGSAEAMIHQFRQWDFPYWLVPSKLPEPDRPKRRPRKSGTPHDLPPARAAMALFQERIEVLGRAVEALPTLVEGFQGGRFVGTFVERIPMGPSRDEVSEEEWEWLCEVLGSDPTSQGDWYPDWAFHIDHPIDVTHVPPQPLVMLIGAYALAGGNMEALLKALHPNPPEVDAEKLSRLLHAKKSEHGEDGLFRRAQQLATFVRGGNTGRGAPPPDLSADEYDVACAITEFRERGWSEDRIYQTLAHLGYTKKEIADLGSLRLRRLEDDLLN
jgi:hypothetical protein